MSDKSLATELSDIQKLKKELLVKEGVLLEQALKSNDPADIIKASEVAEKFFNDIQGGNSKQKSFMFDPFYQDTSLGYKEKPVAISDQLLRRMAKTPIIKAIIGTRIEQVARFCEPQPDKYSTGFVITPKKKYSQEETPELTPEDKGRIAYLTDFILHCGNIENVYHGDDFDSFIRKIVNDTLTMDKLTFEVIEDRRGRPVEFIATDSATMKYASNTRIDQTDQKRKKVNGYFPTYCQVWDDEIIADFYPWELCFGVRNPTTDIRYNGYGMSELEDLIYTVTAMLWSDEYNTRFFSQGSMPKGIMTVASSVSNAQLASFRQEWLSMVAGVYNAHKTPILEADKFNWVDLHKSNQDMEFTKWQEYLIKLTCAIYKIDPSEIGFPLNGSADKAPMFESNNEAKLKYSQDKGLKPLLKFIQAKINKYIIWRIDPNYEFSFVGLDIETEAQEEDRLVKATGSYMEINEARRLKGLKEKPQYDMIANPVIQQAATLEKQMTMFGNPNSNKAVEDQQQGQETQKGLESNPILEEFNHFMKTELLHE